MANVSGLRRRRNITDNQFNNLMNQLVRIEDLLMQIAKPMSGITIKSGDVIKVDDQILGEIFQAGQAGQDGTLPNDDNRILGEPFRVGQEHSGWQPIEGWPPVLDDVYDVLDIASDQPGVYYDQSKVCRLLACDEL